MEWYFFLNNFLMRGKDIACQMNLLNLNSYNILSMWEI